MVVLLRETAIAALPTPSPMAQQSGHERPGGERLPAALRTREGVGVVGTFGRAAQERHRGHLARDAIEDGDVHGRNAIAVHRRRQSVGGGADPLASSAEAAWSSPVSAAATNGLRDPESSPSSRSPSALSMAARTSSKTSGAGLSASTTPM